MSGGSGAPRPWLVMVTGEPGSGKTTLGRALSRELRLPFLSRDDVRGGQLASAGLWTNEMARPSRREAAVEAFVVLVEQLGALGVTAVVEFVVFRDRLGALARLEAAADCLVVHVTCEDAAGRATDRDRTDPLLTRPSVLEALGHPTIESFLADTDQLRVVREGMLTEFAIPTLAVRTDDGYDPSLPEIVEWVVERTRR